MSKTEPLADAARSLATVLRDHYHIEGEPPPPSGGPSDRSVVLVCMAWMRLRQRVDAAYTADPRLGGLTWQQTDAVERLQRVVACLGDWLRIEDPPRRDDDQPHAIDPTTLPDVDPTTPIDSDVVRALNWAAEVLDEEAVSAAPTADDDNPLGLHVDVEHRTVRRDGYDVVVDLSGSRVGWYIFRVVWEACPKQADVDALKSRYPAKWEARHAATATLNKKLELIEIEVYDRALRPIG
jgi:hypothetical protein